MKYVILIHSNPQPWGHPTIDFTPEGRAIPADRRAESERAFDELLGQLRANGELVTAEALAAPQTSTIYRWAGEAPVPTEGPYAETKEHLAGSSSSTALPVSGQRRSPSSSPRPAT